MKCKPPQGGCLRGEVEEECTSSFLVGDLHITAQDVGSCMDGETYFGSDQKYDYKSKLQSPLEPHMEEEDKATPLGCEPENLVEEQATIVVLHEEDEDEISKYEVLSDFCIYYASLQPYDIPSPSYIVNQFTRSSNVDVYAKK